MLDAARINELKEELGEEDFGEVVVLFLEEVEEALGKLQINGDAGSLGDDLHFLKGSLMNLGFAQSAQLCASAESKLQSGTDAAGDVGDIAQSYQAEKIELLEIAGIAA